jgi:hypothetical protein
MQMDGADQHEPASDPGRRNGKWLPGVSGNPAGRKPGTTNRRTALDAQVAVHGPAIMDVVIEAALKGDLVAANIALARIAPPLRSRAERVTFELDPALGFAEQAQQVITAVATGVVDPATGKLLVECLTAAAGLRTIDEFEFRLARLEGKAAGTVKPRGGIVELTT